MKSKDRSPGTPASGRVAWSFLLALLVLLAGCAGAPQVAPQDTAHPAVGEDAGPVPALAFTLSRRSPNYTGDLHPQQVREIFRDARGRYGTTLDYARQTFDALRQHGIHDRRLGRLLDLAGD